MAEDSNNGKPSEESSVPGAMLAPTPVGSPGDYLEIIAEPQRAILTVNSAVTAAGFTLTREDIAKKLQGLGVAEGVDWSAVDRMLTGKQYDRGQIIAQGIPAKPSLDASIKESLKIDSDLKPVLDKEGKADYKNVDNIHQVKKGDVLAVKTPMTPGTPGRDIFGTTLPAQPAKDVQFKLGANTGVSDDGLNLVALVGGYVYHQAGAICVGVTYILKGDVDFHTGNLHYQGDIQILGNVTDGFIVEAEGGIIVEGTVEGADIISHGAGVHIKSGVFGHGKGRIAGKTSVRILGAQDIRIECHEGTVVVDKGLRNCLVDAQHFKADAAGCSVVGGEIQAYGEVAIAVLGGEGCHTHIRILDKATEAAKLRLRDIERMREQVHPKIAPIENRLKGMKAMQEKFGATLSERAKADLKGVADAYAALKKAEHDLDAEKEALHAVMGAAPKHVGKFAVTERMVWGGVLEIYGLHKELEVGDAGKEWVWAPGGLLGRSILPEPAKATGTGVVPDAGKASEATNPLSSPLPGAHPPA